MSTLGAEILVFPSENEPNWLGWFKDHTTTDWRPGEWDHSAWVCTGDPANPQTTSEICRTARCESVIDHRGLCAQCAHALKRLKMSEVDFTNNYVPERPRTRYGSRPPQCAVATGTARCPRHSTSQGLCSFHYSHLQRAQAADAALSHQVWLATGDIPDAPPRAERSCLVLECVMPARSAIALCSSHNVRYKTHAQRASVEVWARTQTPHLAANQFALGHLPEQLRWELLYAVQQRDARNGRLAPSVMRTVVRMTAELPSLSILDEKDVLQLARKHHMSSTASHLIEFARSLRTGRAEMLGITPAPRVSS